MTEVLLQRYMLSTRKFLNYLNCVSYGDVSFSESAQILHYGFVLSLILCGQSNE